MQVVKPSGFEMVDEPVDLHSVFSKLFPVVLHGRRHRDLSDRFGDVGLDERLERWVLVQVVSKFDQGRDETGKGSGFLERRWTADKQ